VLLIWGLSNVILNPTVKFSLVHRVACVDSDTLKSCYRGHTIGVFLLLAIVIVVGGGGGGSSSSHRHFFLEDLMYIFCTLQMFIIDL
jgi:hypothetical protein